MHAQHENVDENYAESEPHILSRATTLGFLFFDLLSTLASFMLDDGYQNKFSAFWNGKKLVRFCLKMFNIAQLDFKMGTFFWNTLYTG